MKNEDKLSLACRILSRRSMSLQELNDALTAKGIPPEAAAETCARVSELGLANDLEYARTLVRRYSARMQGRTAIRVRLRAHGLDAADIEEALSEWEPDYDGLLQLLMMRFEGETDYHTVQKAGNLLYRRGLSSDEIKQALAYYADAAASSDDDDFPAFSDDDD